MELYAIGDLHLPGGQQKPMDIFGEGWIDHPERIRKAWRERVGSADLVLVPGDISWAMTLEEAQEDLEYLGSLTGSIVMIRGNHDYWWSGIGRVRDALPGNVAALQNDHYPLPDGSAICGTRGWDLPDSGSDAHDFKLFQREIGRLELSLKSAVEAGRGPRIAMLHYPPTTQDGRRTQVTDLLEEYGVSLCVYGHLHGPARKRAIQGKLRGVTYQLVACDAIGFAPVHLTTVPHE